MISLPPQKWSKLLGIHESVLACNDCPFFFLASKARHLQFAKQIQDKVPSWASLYSRSYKLVFWIQSIFLLSPLVSSLPSPRVSVNSLPDSSPGLFIFWTVYLGSHLSVSLPEKQVALTVSDSPQAGPSVIYLGHGWWGGCGWLEESNGSGLTRKQQWRRQQNNDQETIQETTLKQKARRAKTLLSSGFQAFISRVTINYDTTSQVQLANFFGKYNCIGT